VAAVTPLEQIAVAHARAEWPRRLGMMLAMLGLAAAMARSTVVPSLPKVVPVVLIVTALGLMGIGIIRRLQYLRRPR
jgi:hypothetical protein